MLMTLTCFEISFLIFDERANHELLTADEPKLLFPYDKDVHGLKQKRLSRISPQGSKIQRVMPLIGPLTRVPTCKLTSQLNGTEQDV